MASNQPAALTPEQWEQVRLRDLNSNLTGESRRAIAKDFNITEGAIRKKFGVRNKLIKSIGTKLAQAEAELNAQPLSIRVEARTFADRMKNLSEHLCGAAEQGAATAHRLSQIANQQTDKIDSVNPEASVGTLQIIAALTRVSNSAAEIGINLIAANKEKLKELDPEAQKLIIHGGLPD